MREMGDDMQQGLEPWSAAARAEPLYMGRRLYQLSYWGS